MYFKYEYLYKPAKRAYTLFIMKKFFKYLGFTIGCTLLIVAASLGIVLNTILSPKKITPLVHELANEHLQADVSFQSVQLSIFSSFPNVSLDIREGAISTRETKPDTLIAFDEIHFAVNPYKYLFNKEVNIHRITLNSADIRTHFNEKGELNWAQIIPTDTTQTEAADTTSIEIKTISLDEIKFEKINLHFTDQVSKSEVQITDFDGLLGCQLSKEVSHFDVDLSTPDLSISYDLKKLLSHTKTSVRGLVTVDRPQRTIQIDRFVVGLNRFFMGCGGTIQKDSISSNRWIDLRLGAKINSIEELLAMIPESIVEKDAHVQANGEVFTRGTLKGEYGENVFPVLTVETEIKNAQFQYTTLPYGIDQLQAKVETHIDLNEKHRSFANIHTFSFSGANSSLSMQGKVNNLLTDPLSDLQITSDIDFGKIAQALPFNDSIKLQGRLVSDLQTHFKLSDVQQSNYGRLGIRGQLEAMGIGIVSVKDSLNLFVNKANATFGTNQRNNQIVQGRNLLEATYEIDSLHFNQKDKFATIVEHTATLSTSPLKDSLAIATIKAEMRAKRCKVGDKPIATLDVKNCFVSGYVQPQKKNKRLPHIHTTLKFDTLKANAIDNKVFITNSGFDVDFQKKNAEEKKWDTNGKIGFRKLRLNSSLCKLPIVFPASVMSMRNDEIILHNAAVRIGESNMRINGKFWNIENALFNQQDLKGKYSLKSNFINCNQLFASIPTSEEEVTQVDSIQSDTTQTTLFVVPKRLDFEMDAHIKKVLLGKMVIDNIEGNILIKNQAIRLDSLKLHTFAADMTSSIIYQAKDSSSGYTGFDLNMKDIQVGKLVLLMPALDSIIPMLRSLDGIVNFHIAAETKLKSDMSIDINSIHAAANLRGDSLVLMDGETFAEISKMLRFKNKERNIIDSVSVNFVIKDGLIDIYPFQISMDRYVAAIGGKHNLDMSFDYHITVLKSPIPFTMGIDVTGNLDDYDFRLRRPKYKNVNTSARTALVDSTASSLKEKFIHTLETAASIE